VIQSATVQQDPVAIDPATLDVLNVVMSDEDIGLFELAGAELSGTGWRSP